MDSDASSSDSRDPDQVSEREGDRQAASDAAFDEALEAALARDDFVTLSRVAFERSLYFHRLERYSIATESSDLALAAWGVYFDGRHDDAFLLARSTELRMVNAAATQHFNQSHFNTTIDLIQRARRLTAVMPSTVLSASTEWNTALMERWRRDFPKALQHALRVIEIYGKHGDSPLNIARAHLFVAQIAQDCAATSSARGEVQRVDQYLQLARKHLEKAHPPADSRHTSAVEGNYRLIYAAYSRLSGRNEYRVGMLESIVTLAQSVNDSILEGQVYTSLGDELSSQGRTGEAQTHYQRAYEILASSQAPSIAVWPLRQLNEYSWQYGRYAVPGVKVS